MAWNEPGKDKDPLGDGANEKDRNRGHRGNDGPPDLDEAWKNFVDKLGTLFGGNGGGSQKKNSDAAFGGILALIFGVLAIVYVMFGFYQVDAKERAVILQLGAFKETRGDGLGWAAPWFTQVIKVDVTGTRSYPTRGSMLTQDENIVELPISVQYNVRDVKDYVLNVRDPETSLKQATDSALRHVVGSTELDQVLSEGRAKMAAEVKLRLQTYLDNYGTGIQVINVNIQQAQPPEEVRFAFDDVTRAKEDEQKLINQAEAYANQIIPEARGKSQRIVQEAAAYKAEVVARAEGEASRFENLLAEYKRAPEVTRKRMYMDAVESVMNKSSKVMVDVSNNNMLYIPMDKLYKPAATGAVFEDVTERAQRETESARPAKSREMR